MRLQFTRRRLHQQADLEVAGMVSQRDRLSVGRTHAALGAEQEELRAEHFLGRPTHAGVLRETKQIAAGPGRVVIGSNGSVVGYVLVERILARLPHQRTDHLATIRHTFGGEISSYFRRKRSECVGWNIT